LFVGIGCPRQEIWMAEHQDRISAVMLGVGAAFNFHSGHVKHAPQWMQIVGLEWLFRLIMEPRRLWKRYFKQNPRFIFLFLKQLLSS
jgi:N-acetylglucosaminyldiphosphoundecaprenol N-acetyl-beta-D-mannosaminyltransferase